MMLKDGHFLATTQFLDVVFLVTLVLLAIMYSCTAVEWVCVE